MKRLIALVFASACLGSLGRDAAAQVIVEGTPILSTPVVATEYRSYPFPYSYYAAIPFPARGYVGYGSQDFPYYGRPYGSPSDPWTWPYMSAAYNYNLLARYYYPPVR